MMTFLLDNLRKIYIMSFSSHCLTLEVLSVKMEFFQKFDGNQCELVEKSLWKLSEGYCAEVLLDLNISSSEN